MKMKQIKQTQEKQVMQRNPTAHHQLTDDQPVPKATAALANFPPNFHC